MRVLVVTSCSKKKKFDSQSFEFTDALKKNKLSYPSTDINNENTYRTTLSKFMLKAQDMYLGSFTYVYNLVRALRKKYSVDLKIISARYGLIDCEDLIIPYECSLTSMSKSERIKKSVDLKVYENLKTQLTSQNYDIVVVILGKEYLETIFSPHLNIDFTKYLGGKLIVLGAQPVLDKIKYQNIEKIYVRAIGDRNKKIKELIGKI